MKLCICEIGKNFVHFRKFAILQVFTCLFGGTGTNWFAYFVRWAILCMKDIVSCTKEFFVLISLLTYIHTFLDIVVKNNIFFLLFIHILPEFVNGLVS